MSIALPASFTLSPLSPLLFLPLILLAIAYQKAGASSLVALAQKVGGISRDNEQKKVVEVAPKLPDPSPRLDFDLKTARTRDHIYANKQLRLPYNQTM